MSCFGAYLFYSIFMKHQPLKGGSEIPDFMRGTGGRFRD